MIQTMSTILNNHLGAIFSHPMVNNRAKKFDPLLQHVQLSPHLGGVCPPADCERETVRQDIGIIEQKLKKPDLNLWASIMPIEGGARVEGLVPIHPDGRDMGLFGALSK